MFAPDAPAQLQQAQAQLLLSVFLSLARRNPSLQLRAYLCQDNEASAVRNLNLICNGAWPWDNQLMPQPLQAVPLEEYQKKAVTSINVSADIEGQEITAMLDSGASSCVMNQHIVEDTGLTDYVQPSDMCYTIANGLTDHSLGFLPQIPTKIGNSEYLIDYEIAPS